MGDRLDTRNQPLGSDRLLIRACGEADIAAIQAIYAHHVLTGTATFEETPPVLDEMLARRAAILAHGCPYLVAERCGAILGYAYAGQYRPRSAFRHTVESTVYLDPAATRQGAARALMEAVISQCGQAGFRQMIAVITDDNPASLAFHTALGFRHAGQLDQVGLKFGRWLGTTLMQRALGPPGHDQK